MDLFAAEIGDGPGRGPPPQPAAAVHRAAHNGHGALYDTGDYAAALDLALAAAGYDELRAEQQRRGPRRRPPARHRRGLLRRDHRRRRRARAPPKENAQVEVHPDGTATILTGTSPHGQGHATAWAMLASDELGIPVERITLQWGDTDLVPEGGGTGGSRSLQQGGAAVRQASQELVEVASQRAAARARGQPGRPGPRQRPERVHGGRRPGHRRCRWPSWPQEERLLRPDRVLGRRARPSRSVRTSPWSRSTPRPARSTLQRLIDGRRRRGDPQPAAGRGPAARRHRPGRGAGAPRGDRLRRRRQPADHDLRRLPVPVRHRGAELRAGRHGDADHLQPARRQGNRRGRLDRRHPCGAERRRSTRSRTSASGTSTCRPRPQRIWQAIRAADGGRHDAGRAHRQRRAADRRGGAAAAARPLPARRPAGCGRPTSAATPPPAAPARCCSTASR